MDLVLITYNGLLAIIPNQTKLTWLLIVKLSPFFTSSSLFNLVYVFNGTSIQFFA